MIKTKQKEIQAARLVPRDLGANNLATIVYPNSRTEIINRRPLKSIKQYYNKRLAEASSKNSRLEHQTLREVRLISKRRNKINDYLHKHQDTRMKKIGNQRFQVIPFYKS